MGEVRSKKKEIKKGLAFALASHFSLLTSHYSCFSLFTSYLLNNEVRKEHIRDLPLVHHAIDPRHDFFADPTFAIDGS